MERNRKTRSPRRATAKPDVFELPPDRVFVVHLDARAHPPRRVVGRVEHITSGKVTHFTSLGELMAFLAAALRNQEPHG